MGGKLQHDGSEWHVDGDGDIVVPVSLTQPAVYLCKRDLLAMLAAVLDVPIRGEGDEEHAVQDEFDNLFSYIHIRYALADCATCERPLAVGSTAYRHRRGGSGRPIYCLDCAMREAIKEAT